MPRRSLRVGLATLALWSAPLDEIAACSCGDHEVGAGRLYLGAGGVVPADAGGIAWAGILRDDDQVTLFKTIRGREVAVRHTIVARGELLLIVPRGGLRPGDRYTVTVREPNWRKMRTYRQQAGARGDTFYKDVPGETTTVVTVDSAALALAGATLQPLAHAVRPLTTSQTGMAGTCSSTVDADVLEFEVALPPALEPYRDHLLYETTVDGQPSHYRTSKCQRRPPGRSFFDPPGRDLIFSDCAGELGFPAGHHRVEVHLATPDGKHRTTASGEFELGCPAPPEPAPAEPAPPAAPEPVPAPMPNLEPPPLETRGCATTSTREAWPLALLLLVLRRRRTTSARDGENMRHGVGFAVSR